jgi:hypothetical protein
MTEMTGAATPIAWLACAIFALIFGAITVLAYKYVLELRAAREQRKNDMVQAAIQLRWNQARLGKEINDEFQDDRAASTALLLLDFTGRTWGRSFLSRLGDRFEINGSELIATINRIIQCEGDGRETALTERDIAVAECFDSLFY